ncbi:rod shape-determining protein [Microbulbifer sp.]|uniref:rod shape-determining protein n=1 Tax=Microbulbifer sp. TaxID=1908541 RepID=UPI003F2F3C20
MLKNLLNKKPGTILYVQIWEKRIRVTDIGSGRIYDQVPQLALEQKKGRRTVAAVGSRASSASGKNIEMVNPFSHPRSLIRDFVAGEQLLQHIFKELSGDTLIPASPTVVLQPMEKTEGGLTDIEIRAFQEMALGAGAREAVVYQGEELTRHTFDYRKVKEKSVSGKRVAAAGEKSGQFIQWFFLLLWLVLIAAMALFGGR